MNKRMLKHGFEADLIADGQIHRFRGPGDKRPNSWFVFHGDHGAFGSWKTGEKYTWSETKPFTTADREEWKRQKEQRHRNQVKQWRRAAGEAAKRWRKAKPCTSHQYLKTKRIRPYGVRVLDGRLLIPVRDHDNLWSLQFIRPDGSKLFLKGGRVTGLYCPIGLSEKPARTLIAEGYATGCTLREKTGLPTIVAFNAGNLEPVAKSIRKQYPTARITIAADNDQWTEGNPGLTKARHAAAMVRGDLIYPDFEGLDVSGKPTDFNDYALLGGEEWQW